MTVQKEKFIDHVKVHRNSRYVTIPAFIRRKLKLLPGDSVELVIWKSNVNKDTEDIE